MTDTRLVANQRVTVWAGPDSGISNWTNGPTLAECNALVNISGAVNWDSFDLNLQASDQQDDRTLTDAAGAKSRGLANFGGNLELVQPTPDDTSSIYRIAYNIFKGDRTKLAVVVRVGPLNSTAAAAGDVVNAYHVLRDADDYVRADQNKPSYAYKVNLLAQDDVSINAIIPAATPGAATVTRIGSGDLTVGTPDFLKVTYQGRNVTVGATYVVSDPSVLLVTPHGCIVPLSSGDATVTASYPGGTTSTALDITVS
jgi:hypothetical protein